VGLQRYGNYHLDRRLFAVHLFHGTETGGNMKTAKALDEMERGPSTALTPLAQSAKNIGRFRN
jgi:hypothetical protein